MTDEVIRAGHGGVLAGAHAHGVEVGAPQHAILVVEARRDRERHSGDAVVGLVIDPCVVAGVPTGPRVLAYVGDRRVVGSEDVAEVALEELLQVGCRHQLARVRQLEELCVGVELVGRWCRGVHVGIGAVARRRRRRSGRGRTGISVGCSASEDEGGHEENSGDTESPFAVHEARSTKSEKVHEATLAGQCPVHLKLYNNQIIFTTKLFY